MNKLLLALVILLIGAPGVGRASVEWPNEPSGAAVLLDCGFDTATCSNRLFDPYATAGRTVTVQQDSGAPLSPSNVMRSLGNYLTGNGGTEMHYTAPTTIREVYVGFWWRTNPEFTGNQVNANKTFFIRGTGGGTNGVFYLRTNPGQDKVLYWSTQLPYNLNQCFGAPDQDHCYPNVNTTPIVPGTWYRVEVYMKASTCPTCRDGEVKWWITQKGGSPVLNGSFQNFAYGPRVDEWVWSETWDGAGNGHGFTSNPAHFIDHLHISAPNCSGGCSSSSDTTPPSQVTGVVVNATASTTASLSWTPAADNVAVAGYQVERCVGAACTAFSNLVTTTVPSITFSGLSPGSVHRVRVKAYDAAGNVSSSYSNVVSFSTSGTILPVVTVVDADGTGANVQWTGDPASIRVFTDTLNLVEPMSAFPVVSETIAHVQSRAVVGSGTGISLAYSTPNVAGNFLALRLTSFPSSVTISNCTDIRGNVWVPVPGATGGSGGHQAIQYAANVQAGANTVTCTMTGAATSLTLDIFEKSGVSRTSPLGQSKLTQQVDPGTGTDAISSGTVTTTTDGELILGGTLQVGSTVYDPVAQFSGTQGPVWYYKDSSGTNMTWTGSYWAGSGYAGLWNTGGHPTSPLDAMRRWVAPADGAISISGTAQIVSGCASDGVNVSIKKNGSTIWSQALTGTGSFPVSVSDTVLATDTIDFLINRNLTDTCDSTLFAPTITLGTSSGSGGTTTSAGTGFTLRHAAVSDSPSEDRVQASAGTIAATFTGADALNDYITSIATFRPAQTGARYSRVWPVGTTFICMVPRDSLGNENTAPDGYHCDSVVAQADTQPPVRSNAQPSGTLASGTTSSVISMVTDEPSFCRYSASSGVSYGSMTLTLDSSVSLLFHSAEVTGLSDGNTYTYYVRCRDFSSNENSTDSTISFSVSASPGDSTSPSQVVGLLGEPLNAGQIGLSWTAATDNVGVTGYEVYGADSGTYFLLGTTSLTSTIISGLSADTVYLMKVRARDGAGNVGAFSEVIVVQTPPRDIVAPSDLSGMVATPLDFQSIDLQWSAGTDNFYIASSSIEQCVGASCSDFVLVATVFSGTSVRLSGLLPQTTYRFRGKHTDAAGNVSANYSAIITGTTLAVPTGTVTAVCPCKHHR